MYRKLFTSHLPVGNAFLCVCLLKCISLPSWCFCFSVAKSCPTLQPCGLQHVRLLCPPVSPMYSNSCPLNQCCYLTISSSPTPFSFSLQSFPASGSFPMSIQGWFPIELTGLISLQSTDSQGSSPAPQFENISSLAFSLLYIPALTSLHDYWKNHSFDHTDLGWQSDVCFLIYCLGLL